MGVSPMAVVLRCVDRYPGRQNTSGTFFGFVVQKNAPLLLIQPEYRLKSRRTAIMGETPMVHFDLPNLSHTLVASGVEEFTTAFLSPNIVHRVRGQILRLRRVRLRSGLTHDPRIPLLRNPFDTRETRMRS